MSVPDNDFNRNSPWLPLQLRLHGRLIVIIGAGNVAMRKAKKLASTGAKLKIIAPIIPEAELNWQLLGIDRTNRHYSGVADVTGAFLVIAATNDYALNARIAIEARSVGALVLRVDAPDDSDFTFPATLRRGALTISFATDGICPSYAKRLKQDANCYYGYRHAKYLEAIAEIKSDFNFKNLPTKERKIQLQALADKEDSFKPGSVAIVGAGPGDLELLTVKAIERLRIADVIVYDALANPAIMNLFAPQAQYINAGKRKLNHTLTQHQINTTLTNLAHNGLRVLRLKGGDPCLFGRVGEELRALYKAGIHVEIVPGVSSLTAVPATVGIPLTDRDLGRDLGAFSLQRQNGKLISATEWHKIANGPETLVLFMGREMLDEACYQLIALGRSPELPAALIISGTLPEQKTIVGTLTSLPDKAKNISTNGPALIIVGNVVQLASVTCCNYVQI
jgi:uroporphyrin-III C-methyltransferase/precorrin-2 dehydrogenase/sirohydrochlorin ferrochelatase